MEGVELPPINNCYHSLSDTSITFANRPHVQQRRRGVLLTDPLVGAEGELEDHNGLGNGSDPTLAASSISIIQQPKSITKLETQQSGDESPSDAECWTYPYPHFQVPTSSCYDKMTREQLLSSKAHALGLVSSKNWIKSAKGGKAIDGNHTPLLTRIKSSPVGKVTKALHGKSSLVPPLGGINEDPRACESRNTKIHSSKVTYTTTVDTVHNRLKTAAGSGGHHSHATPTNQSRPIHTSQNSRSQQRRATSSTGYGQSQGRKQSANISHHPRRTNLAAGINNQQLSNSYLGKVNERLQGILNVKHETSTLVS